MPTPTVTMLGLSLLNVAYIAWVLSLGAPSRRWRTPAAAALLAWLAVLHVALSQRLLLPASISGPAFLAVIVCGVALVGALLFATPARALLLSLDQRQLQLLQGIRVWFGAGFLMWAATGVLPPAFGIVDGFTHVGAGFFGLVAAFACATGAAARRRVWFANAFGLTDILVVATTLALVLLPELGPHHPMMYAVFLSAPLWVCAHLASIVRLVGANAQPSPVTARA